MPAATVRRRSDSNSTHRGAFKKGYILTGKIEKTERPLFAEKLFELRKKQFVLNGLRDAWWVFLVTNFGCEQMNASLYGKAGNLWRTVVSLIGKPNQIRSVKATSQSYSIWKSFLTV